MRLPRPAAGRQITRVLASALALFALTAIASWPLMRVNELTFVRDDAWFTLVCMDHWGRVLS